MAPASAGLVDAHAHIVASDFAADREAVLERAAVAGVARVVAVVENLDEARENLALAQQHPLLSSAAGLYPTVLDREAAAAMVSFIRDHRDRLVAIGEVGLDYWVVTAEPQRALQREILASFVDLSVELDLPLNVHSRSAGREAIRFLRERGARRVLMHAFDGRAQYALEGAEAGFFFSIPPSVVRSPQKQKLVRRLPLEVLLLESDAPVLGPEPRVRNEPANIRVACETIASIKGLAQETVAEVTTANARRVFPRAFLS